VIAADLPSETTRYSAPRDTIRLLPKCIVPILPCNQRRWASRTNRSTRRCRNTTNAYGSATENQIAIWWILGGLAVFVVLGIGAAIVIIAVASMSSEPNNNRFEANANAPNRNINAYRPRTQQCQCELDS